MSSHCYLQLSGVRTFIYIKSQRSLILFEYIAKFWAQITVIINIHLKKHDIRIPTRYGRLSLDAFKW